MEQFLQSKKFIWAKRVLQICIVLLFSIGPLFAQQPGNALNFDGSNDRVSLPNSLVTAATSPSNSAITIEYWFRGSNAQSAVRLQNGNNYIIAGWGSNTSSQTHIISSDGGSGNGLPVGVGVNDGRWHHVAMTWQRNTTNGFKSYLDGQLVAQRNSANVALPVVTANGFIGAFNGSSEFTNGSIDEVRIYTTTRTQAEIQSDMFDLSSTLPTGLLAYYKFNQGTASGTNTTITTLSDLTTNAHNGTLLGFGLSSTSSNWVESYAAVVPRSLQANSINSNGFTASFLAPLNGTVDNYILEVYTNPLLTNPILGSPFTLASTELSKSITGLLPGRYYFRVRANKTSLTGQGNFTEINTVEIPFSAPGNALAFDGSNDYVELPSGIVSNLQDVTFETWFLLNNNNTWQRVFDFGTGTSKYILFTPSPGRGPSNSGLFEIYNGSLSQELQSNQAFQIGKWYHIAITLNDLTNTGKLYINGELVDENNAITIKPSDLGNTTQNWIGRSHYSDPLFNGRIDEFRIWNTVRTQEQIRANMNNQVDPSSTGLVDYYRFDQGIAGSINTGLTELADLKTPANNGTLINFGLILSATSNYVESYAMVIPKLLQASNITESSFTVNWEAAPVGLVTGYFVDVSTNENFTTQITGSPFFVSGNTTLSRQITGLQSNLNYYYRVRADKSNLTGSGAISPTNQVRTLNVLNPPGNCLAFDGNQDGVLVPNMPMGHIANFTMEAWINPTTLSVNHQALFSYGFDNGSTGNGISINIDATGKLNLLIGGVTSHIYSGFTFPSTNRWYHVAVTRSNGITRAFVNGEQAPVTVSNNPFNPTQFYIGSNTNVRFFNGRMDEFRFYNQALSAEQIKADMADTVSVLPQNLLAYYNFDQGSPSVTNTGINILTDVSGNNRNGSLLNFALSGSNSNWISSNAMVRPIVLPASNITPSGFTANWTRPIFIDVASYVLDVSTNPQFTGIVGGSPFSLDSLTYSKAITSLLEGTYYYRVRSLTANIPNQESVSETMSVLIKYTPPGNALSLDGSNDLLTIDNATGINNRFADHKITVEGWFLLKALPNPGQMPAIITENYNGAGGYNILFSIYLFQNKIWGGFHDGNWTAANVEYSFDINKWYHVAATYDKTIIKLYVNGDLIATKNSTMNLPRGSEDWSIGRRWDYNEFINGNFDEIKIYNAALTEEQINLDLRDTGLVLPNKAVVYYNFDQGVSAANNSHIVNVLDKSPSAYHAILTNSSLTGTTSNFIESYAIAVPKALAATDVNPTGFTANWEVSKIGEVNNYLLEVSTTKDFSGLIASAYVLSNTTTSRVFNTLTGGTYYYRVRANNIRTNINQQGGYSRVIQVDVPYTPPGNAMAFDGINDRLKLDDPTVGNFGTSNWTVEFWMKTSSAQTLQIISKRETCGDGHFWNIGMSANGTLFYELDNASRSQLMQVGTNVNTKVNDGRWHHVAWVREGINVKVYIDGIVRANNNSNGVISQGVGNPIDIGALFCYSGNYQGSLDEIRIWYNARSSEQINAAMKAPVDPNAIGLKLYLDFDNGVGGAQNYDQTYVIDKSVSKANARIINMELEALNTNFVQSYAMVVPTQLEPSEITPNGFKLNWTAPAVGTVSNYLVDVSLSSNFTAPISGSPFNVSGGQTSFSIDGLAPSTFYCRIRANQSGKPYSNEGTPSNVKIVKLEYTPPGNALKFDGTNDYGTIPRPISGDFTIEYWMKTNQVTTNWIGVVDMEIGGQPGDYRNFIGGGTDKIGFGVGSNGQDPTLYSTTSINNGKWYHIAFTREQSTGQIRLYVNGNLEANGSSGTGNLTASALITLGAVNTYRGSSSNSFNGALDELRIWNVVRTPAEIGEYFKDTVDRNSAGLVAYYNFDQGIADGSNSGVTTLLDIAGTDNGGTLYNFALNGVNSNWVKTYNISVASPSNLTTTTNLCSRIDLNWQLGSTNPTANCEVSVYCDNDNFKQYVYADNELIAIYPFNTTSCFFNVNQTYNGVKLIRGVDYKFTVRTAYAPPLFKYVQTSAPSNISLGRFKPNPEVPSGFTATTNKCDGSVDLGWSWFDVNPTNGFVFNRSIDSLMSNPVVTTLSGTVRSYTDAGLQRGQYYFYRLFARNDCYVPNAPDSMFAGVSDTVVIIGGLSPTVPSRPNNIRLFSDSINNIITIRWNDNSNFEDKYSVERTAVGGGTSSFEVNANDTVYEDQMAAACVNYNYSIKVYSGCALNGISSLGINQTRLTPNLANTFEPGTIYKLKCSKGYFPDRVELNWNNRNNGQLTTIRIYRKVASSTNDSILINSVLAGSGLYVDNTTIAGVMYRYYLIGETQCAGVTRFSNMASDLGFRSPSGVVNGTITYQGGFAVEGARVLVQNTSAYQGGALQFDGVNDYVEIPHQASQNPTNNAITIEAWYKPLVRKSFVIASKMDSLTGGYLLMYDSTNNRIEFTIASAVDKQTVYVENPFESFTSYNQITATYAPDSIRIYVNGIEGKTVMTTNTGLGASSGPIYLGSDPNLGIYGFGNMDEVRLWSIAKSKAQIIRDFNRTSGSNNANLFLYLTFDDRFPGLTETFDQSNLNLVFKENHGLLKNGCNFSDSIPTSSQLALANYTDKNGGYTVENIRYLGTGQNFLVVPTLDIHTFSPNNKVIFLGDGSQVLNNVDFLDNSSFEFVGRVNYAGTTCPASGANVLIDGQLAVLNGQAVLVNDSGKFVVRVPIGNHKVSLVQDKHVFSRGEFPPSGLYNFNSPASAVFTDSTFLKVVGRVAGGNVELNKVPGLGRSINNIGKAQFTFNSTGQAGIAGCFSRSIVTNDSSGEYITYLLPLRYTINGLRLVNNPDPTLLTNPEFNNPNVLDLSNIPSDTLIVDTLVTPTFSRVDSIQYTKRLDFKFYTKPNIYVTKLGVPFDSLVNNFIGESEIEINDSVTLSIANNEMGYPVFVQAKPYSSMVKVIEIYNNIDLSSSHPAKYNKVPVSGTLKFSNNIASATDSIREVYIKNGFFEYNFVVGAPNHLRNSIYPQYSYTKTFQLDFIPDVGLTVSYNPLETDPVNKNYRGFILGTRPGGTSFTTKGPALVDFVLRDPPGSASSTTWSKETSYTTVKAYNFTKSFGQKLEGMWDFGTKTINVAAPLGIGIITETEVVNNLTLGISSTQTMSGEGELVTSTTNTRTISTGGDPGSVGASADIYFGTSRNMVFGTADQIEVLDTQTCRLASLRVGAEVCTGPEVNGYRLGKRTGFFISPTEIASTFAYTQDEILNLIIPDLEELRNSYILLDVRNIRGEKKYTSVFSDENDPEFSRKFASNNDDPIWGGLRSSPTPFDKELRDSMGPSYIFRGDTPYDTDSIRYFNDQIRLWKNAIARNEKAKFKAFSGNQQGIPGGKNISIGKAAYSEDFNTTQEETSTETFELNFGQELTWVLGFESFLGGVEKTSNISFEQTIGRSRSTTVSTSNTFSYTLQDGDDGDLISVDIMNPDAGGSHLFKLRAGKTSCPYEGAVNAMFYDPDNDTITATTMLEDGFEIQPATAQNDVPVINVQQKTIYNVPAEDEAVFVLELGNLSEGRQDRTYSLRVDQASNPNGAIIKVDGLDPNRDFDVPYGTTLQKTLTIERGPINYDYNNIKLIFKSSCDDDIFDTVSISARFLPTCTGVTIKSPDDRWVVNNSFNDTLPVLIGGYNYNYGGFKAVHFQYKPAAGNVWYTEKTFFRDTPDVNNMIPIGSPDIFYPFNMRNLPDGKYELRAVTECIAPGYPNSRISSAVLQGTVDRVNPSPFGNPSPGDGILSPNDEISIKFNETIDQSTLSLSNFEVKGVLNKTNLRSNSSLYLDGDNDYAEVPVGLNLQRLPFTIEMWHKRGKLGHYVLASQGSDTAASFELGYTADNKLYFKVGEEMVTSNLSLLDTTSFNFIAVAYNADLQIADLYVNNFVVNIGNNRIFNPYESSGKFYIGKASNNNPSYTKGNIYEMRIWSGYRTLVDANNTKSILLNGTEAGLIANWKMDEASGTELKDYARSRNASIVNAQWMMSPRGHAYGFGGNGFITVPTNTFGLSKEMDFTLEFWFKSNQGNNVCLMSNGKGDSSDLNPNLKWSIETDSQGRIVLKHNNRSFQATNTNYFDGNWHHFAMVMKRSSNLSAYIDGNLQNSSQAVNFEQFGGGKLWIGSRGWNNYALPIFDSTDMPFTGSVDEIRIWQTSRLLEQIRRDKNNRLTGNESGLVLYLPFESYAEVMGFPILSVTTVDLVSGGTRNFTSVGTSAFNQESPTIKLPRPVQDINFSYSVNNDQIIITPTTSNEFIENVTLDITVKNIKDLNGNTMQSPKTWIAFMDRNQVKWQDDSRSFVKQSLTPMTFTARIINSGGALKEFTIGNLPNWLRATPAFGMISPNSSQDIEFTIDQNLNIGAYEADLTLNTDFGFADKLLVKLKVNGTAPVWNVDPSLYTKSMSIIGQVRINNVISSNSDDILAAFVGEQCRGFAKVTYYEQLDRYIVFMDVYGVNENEQLEFRIWNSATGKTHVDVLPALQFQTNTLVGSVLAPQVFNALDKVNQTIFVKPGWNWISFNLLTPDSNNLGNLFKSVSLSNGAVLKNNEQLAIYDQTQGWTGNLANFNMGMKPEHSYLFFTHTSDTLIVKGVEANPQLRPISINQGWNYIGYVGQRNLNVNDAFGAFASKQNDLIKGQVQFAVYDSTLGWIGSFTTLMPGRGYQYYANGTGVLRYPRSAMFGKSSNDNTITSKYWKLNPYGFENNMNLIVKVDACNEVLKSGQLLLGAFVNNELRGFSKVTQINNETYSYFLTVAGKYQEQVTFKLLQESTGEVFPIQTELVFEPNALKGSLTSPIAMSSSKEVPCTENAVIASQLEISLYPVPSKENVSVKISQPTDSDVQIKIFDLSGKQIQAKSIGLLKKGIHELNLNLDAIAEGVYIVEVVSGTESQRSKLIRIQ